MLPGIQIDAPQCKACSGGYKDEGYTGEGKGECKGMQRMLRRMQRRNMLRQMQRRRQRRMQRMLRKAQRRRNLRKVATPGKSHPSHPQKHVWRAFLGQRHAEAKTWPGPVSRHLEKVAQTIRKSMSGNIPWPTPTRGQNIDKTLPRLVSRHLEHKLSNNLQKHP